VNVIQDTDVRTSALASIQQWVADLRGIMSFAGSLFCVGIGIILLHTGVHASGLPIMAAMGCIAAGSILGFIFGIPKTPDTTVVAPAQNSGHAAPQLQTNTNLEQISDWLTKILVGASLVQFRELLSFFKEVAKSLSLDLPDGSKSPAFAAFLMVYFLIGGFLVTYLLTRLYLPGALTRAAEQKLRDVETTVREINSKIESVIESDPNKGLFGGKSTENNRSLTAKVLPDENSNENFKVHLEVRSTDPKNPLTSAVVFHLHPTYTPAAKWVTPEEGVAKLDKDAWGAFTVGAEIADEPTRLELDLAQLPDAPEKFKSR
jgi:hypothetical protein